MNALKEIIDYKDLLLIQDLFFRADFCPQLHRAHSASKRYCLDALKDWASATCFLVFQFSGSTHMRINEPGSLLARKIEEKGLWLGTKNCRYLC